MRTEFPARLTLPPPRPARYTGAPPLTPSRPPKGHDHGAQARPGLAVQSPPGHRLRPGDPPQPPRADRQERRGVDRPRPEARLGRQEGADRLAQEGARPRHEYRLLDRRA